LFLNPTDAAQQCLCCQRNSVISIVSLAKFSTPFSPVTDLSVHLITMEVSVQVRQCSEIWMCFLYHSNMVCFQGFKQRREGK